MIIVGVDPGLANCGVVAIVHGEVAHVDVHRSSPSKQVAGRKVKSTLAARLAAHVELARGVHRADVLAIEVPSFPPGARPAALLFASFGVWCGATNASCAVRMMSTKAWRAALGLVPRETTEERKADTEARMKERWPEFEAMLTRKKVPASKREHAWDALALATVAMDEVGA